MVVVRKPLSKARHQYFSFYNEQDCAFLKEYLESRLRAGQNLKPESPVIAAKSGKGGFIYTTNIGDGIRAAIRNAGFDWRPYLLRNFFETQMMIAESKGLILRDYRVFWMGHKGDIEHRYSLNKQRLPSHVVEDLRASYKRASSLIMTTKSVSDAEQESKHLKMMREQFLYSVHYTFQEVTGMGNLAEMPQAEFDKLMDAKRPSGQVRPRQMIVPMSELKKFIDQGFEFVDRLSNDEAIVKLPSQS